MQSKLLTQQEIQIAKEKLLHCLEKFDTKQEKVSQTLFNVYPDEMRAIAKLIAQEDKREYPSADDPCEDCGAMKGENGECDCDKLTIEQITEHYESEREDDEERQYEEEANLAVSCTCGAWQFNSDKTKVLHIADCCCGAQ